MMKGFNTQILLFTLVALISCSHPAVDQNKREILVKKYDLMHFKGDKPVFMSVDEFFDGNNDEGSIAANVDVKPKISEYYSTFKMLENNSKVDGVFVEISDVNIYNGKLDDNEWFYSSTIYIVGDITEDEVESATRSLRPDEVEYDTDHQFQTSDERFKGKKVIYVWWD